VVAREADFFIEEQTPGVHLRLQVKEWLLRQNTPYQEIVIAETVELGRMMALDGKIMLTEADEAFYHEMLVHPIMMTLEAPEMIAVIGGGDGGTVREVLYHPTVRKVFWVEIDEAVITAARSLLPSVNAGVLEDPRVELTVAPGEQWLAGYAEAFDAIIVDGTDPVGPAVPLFEHPFFQTCRRALKPHGMLALQCGTPFYFRDEVQMVWSNLQKVFSRVKLYLGFVPTYPASLWSYAMAGEHLQVPDLAEIKRRQSQRGLNHCRYYSPEIHLSSFVLPPFVQELIKFK